MFLTLNLAMGIPCKVILKGDFFHVQTGSMFVWECIVVGNTES